MRKKLGCFERSLVIIRSLWRGPGAEGEHEENRGDLGQRMVALHPQWLGGKGVKG